jgi:hypothetical protein
MFVPEGAHLLTIERNGEVLSLGSVMVTDGRHVTRGIYPESGTKRPPPDPGPGPADTAFVACWQARPSGGLDLERSFGPAGSIGSTDRRLAYFGGMFETRARIEPLIVGIQSFLGTVYESDRSSRQTTQGFGWSVLLHAGVGTSLAPPIAASITLGIGGSGATGIIRQALELPIEARVELPGQTWAMGYARTTLVFSDQRAHGSGIPLFDELEAGVELKRLDISPLNVGLRLQYREALGQRFIGAWLLFGVRQCRRPARNNPDGCNPREEVVAP